MREQAAPPDHPRPPTENPWRDWWDGDPAGGTGAGAGAGAGTLDAERAARTSDWAARLRARPTARTGAGVGEEPPSSAGYWSPEALFAESRRLEREEALSGRSPSHVRQLLEVLGLPEGATPAEVARAYRRLAKQHHPDRFVSADPATRAHHEAEMRRIIDAYRALRDLERA